MPVALDLILLRQTECTSWILGIDFIIVHGLFNHQLVNYHNLHRWNWSTELQALDRVHRLGQTKSVKVIRFIVRQSVEERMLDIQERKNILTGKLGMSKLEEQQERLENIRILFKSPRPIVPISMAR